MSVSFVHSNAFHRHFFRFVAGIVLVDQLFPSVNPHPGGKSPILKALFMSVSAAGNHFPAKNSREVLSSRQMVIVLSNADPEKGITG